MELICGGGYEIKKNKQKWPTWYLIIFAIIIAGIIIWTISAISSNKQLDDAKKAVNEYSSSSGIKSFEDTAAEYNMTPEQLQKAIEQGISPSDIKY